MSETLKDIAEGADGALDDAGSSLIDTQRDLVDGLKDAASDETEESKRLLGKAERKVQAAIDAIIEAQVYLSDVEPPEDKDDGGGDDPGELEEEDDDES